MLNVHTKSPIPAYVKNYNSLQRWQIEFFTINLKFKAEQMTDM